MRILLVKHSGPCLHRHTLAVVHGPPWVLSGECILGWAWRPRRATAPGRGLAVLPGPAAVVAARYDDSPVGPYLELTVSEPVRAGLRVGLCVTSITVSSYEVADACRTTWGLPAEPGRLQWSADGDERALHWVERGMTVRGLPWGPAWSAALPVRSLQQGPEGPVVLPRGFRGGRVRLARVEIAAVAGQPLPHLAGSHAGAVMAEVRVTARPPRRPVGLFSSVPMARAAFGRVGGGRLNGSGRMAQLVRAQPSHG